MTRLVPAVRGFGRMLGVGAVTLALLELGAVLVFALPIRGIPAPEALRAALGRSAERTDPSARLRAQEAPAWMQQHVLHPYLGFVRDPDARRHVLNERVVAVPVNELGFFGPTPDANADPGTFRVALAGGSVAAELFLEAGDRLAHELEASGALDGRRVVLFSLALDGMKQPQQLMSVAYVLARGARFDLVVNLDGYNEVALPTAENVPFGVAPEFPRSWRAYASRVPSLDTVRIAGRLAAESERIERARTVIGASWLRHSRLALLVWHALAQRHAVARARLERLLRDELSGGARTNAEVRGPWTPPASEAALAAELAALWRRSSVQLWHLLRANGIAYAHFLQPSQYVKGSKSLTDRERRVALSPQDDLYRQGAERGYLRLRAEGEALRAEGVPFHDLTAIFAGQTGEIYRDHCCHLHAEGYARLAEEMARVLAGSLRESRASR